MADFWKSHEIILKKYRAYQARRAQELAVKHFRRECPVNRMAARISLATAVLAAIKQGGY